MVTLNCFYMFIIIRRSSVKPTFLVQERSSIHTVPTNPYSQLDKAPIVSLSDKYRGRIYLTYYAPCGRSCMHLIKIYAFICCFLVPKNKNIEAVSSICYIGYLVVSQLCHGNISVDYTVHSKYFKDTVEKNIHINSIMVIMHW